MNIGFTPQEFSTISPTYNTQLNTGTGIINPATGKAVSSVESMNEIRKTGANECQTCADRKYVDGSDDPGVSFKTPAKIAPDESLVKVRSHEYEHVHRDRAKAENEGREVISQNVKLNNAICPECGCVYVSGGLTTTVSQEKPELTRSEELREALLASGMDILGENVDVYA
ncbi:MAG: hypothetical protein R3Y53_10925 [Bacillota bacterium]